MLQKKLQNMLSLSFPDDLNDQAITFSEPPVVEDDACVIPKHNTLWLRLPHAVARNMVVTVDVNLQCEKATITCGDFDLELSVHVDPQGALKPTATKRNMHLLGEGNRVTKVNAGQQQLVFSFLAGTLTASINGETVLRAEDPYPKDLGQAISLEFWGRQAINKIRVDAEPAANTARSYSVQRDDFFLEANVDFTGFLYRSAFDHDMFDCMMAQYASWGVSRLHWIHNPQEHGYWMNDANGVEPTLTHHIAQTKDNVGDILSAAVRAAHAHGITFFGLIKPFDRGHVTEIGQRAGVTDPFIQANPQLCMSRRPRAESTEQQPLTRIDLVAQDTQPASFNTNDLTLLVSDDNNNWQPVEGNVNCQELVEEYPRFAFTSQGPEPIGEKRSCRVFRFTGLSITQQYFMLRCNKTGRSFCNDPVNMLHAYAADQKQRLTLGVTTRRFITHKQDAEHPRIWFDHMPDSPSCVFPGYEPMHWPVAFDQEEMLLAATREHEERIVGLLSPAYEASRKFWLDDVKAVLDAGADGVELRMRSHHSLMSWRDVGFEEPIRNAYQEKHGCDLWQLSDEQIDWRSLRQLRGHGYTQFIQDAKKLVASRGKKLGLHISVSMDMHPGQGGAMNMHWDWKTWLAQRLADSITFKQTMPGTQLAKEVLAAAGDVPVIYTPYSSPSVAYLQARIAAAKAEGFAGYQQYVPLFRVAPNAQLTDVKEPLINVYRNAFGDNAKTLSL